MAAIRQTPGQIHPNRIPVVEHRAEQRGIAVDLRGHHQHIPRLELWIRSQPLQHLIAHQLHLPPGAWSGLKQQRAVIRLPFQGFTAAWFHQLLLHLLQQRGGTTFPLSNPHWIGKQIPLAHLPQLTIATALQQLLELGPHPSERGLQSRCLLKPAPIGRLCPGCPQLLTAASAALPEIAAGGEQIHLNVGAAGEGLDQFHLHRRQGTDTEQTDHLWQHLGVHGSRAQPLHSGMHLQAERLAMQRRSQLPSQ